MTYTQKLKMKNRLLTAISLTICMLCIRSPLVHASDFSNYPHVNASKQAGHVILRAEASDASESLGDYHNGVVLSAANYNEDWASVVIPGLKYLSGYIRKNLLSYDENFCYDIAIAEVIEDGNGIVPLLHYFDGTELGDCTNGMRVNILADIGEEWHLVKFGDVAGYLPTKNLQKTGQYSNNPYNYLPAIGYGAYLYDEDAYGKNPFIDVDGFINTTRFPNSGPGDLDNRTGSLVSTSPVSIIALSSDVAQLEYFPCFGFGPREYLHTFMFDDIFHDAVMTYEAGDYHIGSGIRAGLYTLEIAEGLDGLLRIEPENGSLSILYELEGLATYTVYLPENANVTLKSGTLSTITHDSVFIPDDSSISGTMRLLGGQQIIVSHEDSFSIMPMEGCDEGYYRLSTFLVDSGAQPQGEMIKLRKGESAKLYLRQGEFVEFIGCTLEKDISNG